MCRVDYCDEYPEFHRTTYPQARKAHRCVECGRAIHAGEIYEYNVCKFDGRLLVDRICVHCQIAREWLSVACGGSVIGEVLEELVEHWEESTVFRSMTLGRLIVGMRRKWRDGDDPQPDVIAVRRAADPDLVAA